MLPNEEIKFLFRSIVKDWFRDKVTGNARAKRQKWK